MRRVSKTISFEIPAEVIRNYVEELVEEIVPAMIDAKLRSLHTMPIGEVSRILAGAEERRELARSGGKARAETLSPEERSSIAKKAAETRWGKKPEPAKTGSELYITSIGQGQSPEGLVRIEARFFKVAQLIASKPRWTGPELATACLKHMADGEYDRTRHSLIERGFLIKHGIKSHSTYDVTEKCAEYLAVASEARIEETVRALTEDGCISQAERVQKIQERLATAGPEGMTSGDLAKGFSEPLATQWRKAMTIALEQGLIEVRSVGRFNQRTFVLKGSPKRKPAPPEAEAKPEPPPRRPEPPPRRLKDKADAKIQKVIETLAEHPAGPMTEDELARAVNLERRTLQAMVPIFSRHKIIATRHEDSETLYSLNKERAGKWLDDRFRQEDLHLNGSAHA